MILIKMKEIGENFLG